MVTPISDASPIRPGRILFIQKPVKRAAGIVTTTVNIPQALSFRSFTTTLAVAAKVARMISSVATVMAMPAEGPSSSRVICGNDLPLWRTEASRTMKSWTPPARQEPSTIQQKPGK